MKDLINNLSEELKKPENRKTILWIIGGFIVFLLFMRMISAKPEPFHSTDQCGQSYFSPYRDHIPYPEDGSLDSTSDIKDKLIDIKPCHPSCCGKQWPVPFDNLDSNQLRQCIQNNNKQGQPFVQTPYRCSVGATGCPCQDIDAYLFEASRGGNNGKGSPNRVPESWKISDKKVDYVNDRDFYYPYERLNSQKSGIESSRNLTDHNQTRASYDVKNITGISAPSKEDQLANQQ